MLLVLNSLLTQLQEVGPNNLHRASFLQDELLNLVFSSSQQEPECLGRAIFLAKRAADILSKLDEDQEAQGLAEIFWHKVSACLQVEPQNVRFNRDINRIITELIVELEKSAITDALTGLNNRSYLEKSLRREIERVNRYQHQTFSLVLLDIDFFKRFNDQYGHQVGDDVLRVVARLITSTQRRTDISARYGGEEFCYILPSTVLEGGRILAEKLRAAVEGFPFVVEIDTAGSITQSQVPITISLGVSEYRPGETLEALVRRTDEALYSAKRNGRNQVVQAPAQAQSLANAF